MHSTNNKLLYRTKTVRDDSTNGVRSTVSFCINRFKVIGKVGSSMVVDCMHVIWRKNSMEKSFTAASGISMHLIGYCSEQVHLLHLVCCLMSHNHGIQYQKK